jgi:hypothetical protein
MKRILLILVGTGLLLSLAELDREGAGPNNGRKINTNRRYAERQRPNLCRPSGA